MKRIILGVAALAAACFAFLPGGALGAGSLPTVTVKLTGATGITVSGTPAAGANQFVATFSGSVPKGANGPNFGIVRFNHGVDPKQAVKAVNAAHGDLDAISAYGALIVEAGAPSTVQAVLTPGYDYYAINSTGNGDPVFSPMLTLDTSGQPAALPKPAQTQAAIEFGFRGPTTLHNGSLIRAEDSGYLVHMIDLIGVANKATGAKVVKLLKEGKDNQAEKLARSDVELQGPVSPGGLQQQVLHAKPGYYVEACFMDTQDGREHTALGMERLVQVR